jgi:hypothetical protein
VSGGVHEQHAKKHDMASNATRLCVVNLKSRHGTNLGLLDIEEVDVVGCGVQDGEEEHRVCKLPMHPQVFIEWQESQLRSNDAHDGTTDGKKDEHTVYTQDETSTTRDPNGELKGIQAGQTGIGRLFPPNISVSQTLLE